jgi:hypothetical protein
VLRLTVTFFALRKALERAPAGWRRRRRPDKAAAFAGEITFGTPMLDIAADPFLAQPVSIEVSM